MFVYVPEAKCSFRAFQYLLFVHCLHIPALIASSPQRCNGQKALSFSSSTVLTLLTMVPNVRIGSVSHTVGWKPECLIVTWCL